MPSTQQCEPNGTSTAVAARRVDRTYDGRNRVRTLKFPDGAGDQTWTYTLDGQPKTVSVSNPKVTQPTLTTFEYFRRGLPKSESVDIQDSSYAVTWGYTGNGHLATQIYPSGLSIGYLPNALGQPTQAGAYATDVRYYPNGAIKSFTYGNGVVHTMEQNVRQLPSRSTDCKVAGTCAVADMRLDLSYTYDRTGNVATITDGLYGRQNRTMKYDGLGRLTSADSPMFGEALYTYNVLDDLTQISVSGGTSPRNHHLCYDGATRRLTTLRTGSCTGTIVRSMSYDVQGNVTTNGAQSYTFDFGNRLREAPGKEWYAYDGFGHRVVSCETADCAHFFYSSKGQLLYTHDVRNNKRVDHIQLGNSLVALRERAIGSTSPTAKYQHTDMLGTPIAVTNSTQAFITKHEYEAYGQLVNGTLQDGPGYTGHVQDKATGLTYMQQRYYDPLLGRFLSVDPIAAASNYSRSVNRYSYANSNPYSYVDPDGKFAVWVHWEITYSAARDAGYSVGESVSLANRAWMADWEGGSQGTDPLATARHAMRSVGDSEETARNNHQRLIADARAAGDLGLASHAIQDFFASAHGPFRLWTGFDGIVESITHLWSDMFPTQDARDAARSATKEMLESERKKKSTGTPGMSTSSSRRACEQQPVICEDGPFPIPDLIRNRDWL